MNGLKLIPKNTLINNYIFLAQIGTGSYGNVYYAQNIYNKNFCAIKHLIILMDHTELI